MKKYTKITDIIAYILLALAVTACSTAEKLIDKAVKKDPTILQAYADTVTLTKYEVDSIEVIIGDTVIWDRIIKEVEYDTIINYDLISIQRKKTRQEIRKASKLQKLIEKNDAKYKKREQKYKQQLDKQAQDYEYKITKLQDKLAAKQKRKETKNRFWLGFAAGILSLFGVSFALWRLFK